MSCKVPATVGWRCPVCQRPLSLSNSGERWACESGHHFDVAREGYVNLLVPGRRRSRQPGDSVEMIRSRRRFLATGCYDPLTSALASEVEALGAQAVLDVGCGEGHHTRALPARTVLGIDVAKTAVAVAARSHPQGRYAVASAAEVPLGDGAVDAAVVVFGPVLAAELSRVVVPGGWVVVVSPGPLHLARLRELVYAHSRPHAPKTPLDERFDKARCTRLRFPVVVEDQETLADLFAMTPYRWHAPPGIERRLSEAARRRFETEADIRLAVYRRP